ncbi:MAG TPA: carbonic anhydrase, partial [Acidobacteriaceae bacterium]|nr:carbonic anhydrase [Acidobacteriaceae bacterium]
GMDAYAPAIADAQTIDTPQEALQRLLDGNKRYLDQHLTSFSKDLGRIRQHTTEKQEPFASVLSCADSRVPVEIIFDQAIGDVFVCRIAGNIATPETIASLEYGVAVLGTKALLVLGHGSCGAVSATISVKAAPGQISSLYAYIYPAVEQAGKVVDVASKQNAKNQANLLRSASPVLSDSVKQKKLIIAAAFYDVSTGEVSLLKE